MNWEPEPSSESILKVLLSLPLRLTLEQLYLFEGSSPWPYELRSLIVFTHNHYYVYKHEGLDRWVKCNDAYVSQVEGGWTQIISECL